MTARAPAGATGGKLPVEHVAALLVEAGRLQREATRARRRGQVERAAALLADARLLAEDAASYALPSGMRLSVEATRSLLDRQAATLAAARGG